MSASSHVVIEVHDRVLTLTLQRPERRNALTVAMYDALVAGLEQARDDDNIRVILIRGSAGHFTSGNDLMDFMNTPPTGQDSPVFRFLHMLVAMPKPIVAAVDGWAVGIGTTMLLHCDLVYASTKAQFQVPFVNLGLVPEAGSSLLMPAIMGHVRAARLLLLGEKIDAATALSMNLVSDVVDGDVNAWAMEKAVTLSLRAPEAVRLSKAFMKASLKTALPAVMEAEGAVFAERLGSAEAKEAMTAFFEKREPRF